MAEKVLYYDLAHYTKDTVFNPLATTSTILTREGIEFSNSGDFIVVISGPPGGGKDTLVEKMVESGIYGRPMTVTTRKQREHEKNNDPYIRMKTKKEFRQKEKEGYFIETNLHFGNLYGTPVHEYMRVRAEGKIPLYRVDPNGARAMMQKAKNGEHPFGNCNVIYGFIIPPVIPDIYDRLKIREINDGKSEKEAAEIAENRIANSVIEDLQAMPEAHYILLNHTGRIDALTELFNKEVKRIVTIE